MGSRPVNPKGGHNHEPRGVGRSPGYTSFSGHTRAYHIRAAVAGEAARELEDRVYVGKEGGWLEGKVEMRHSREGDRKEDGGRGREERTGD